MITIDGSVGEGGGQILRTALGLSLVTKRPFHITNIRANRKKPGLLRQHLTAVKAAVEIGRCSVQGAAIGASELVLTPADIKAGKYHFSIGTAGSCTLVFQAVLPALLAAEGESEVTIQGGTHNPFAPPFDFLQASFLPVLNTMGAEFSARLERHGFFPAGGGKITVAVRSTGVLQPLHICSLSNPRCSAKAVCADLPGHIGERELEVVRSKLEVDDNDLQHVQPEGVGPGNILTIFVHSDQITESFTGFGQRNVRAEKVAGQTVNQVMKYLDTGAPIGPHLADQLLIPIALAGSGSFITCEPTNHTLTNIAVIKKFLDVEFSVENIDGLQWKIALEK